MLREVIQVAVHGRTGRISDGTERRLPSLHLARLFEFATAVGATPGPAGTAARLTKFLASE
jgi:hypothetical protein